MHASRERKYSLELNFELKDLFIWQTLIQLKIDFDKLIIVNFFLDFFWVPYKRIIKY